MNLKTRARKLLADFKGESYSFGLGVMDNVGKYAAAEGRTALVIGSVAQLPRLVEEVLGSLDKHGVKPAGDRIVPGAAPNAPREDVYRLANYILLFDPDCIVAVGGGSSIDATKAANVIASLGRESPEIDSYFGTGLVTAALQRTGSKLRPLIAVQTAASSAAHLTKYSNVTDPVAGQKKLLVDEALTPPKAVFDYGVTQSMPVDLTIDGALDGLAHSLEVFWGAGEKTYALVREITEVTAGLVVKYAQRAIESPQDLQAREGLGLATDLGGYAIMVGGTNGAHLTSFSLVDITSHGRACGIMNPYYTVFFSPVMEEKLRLVGSVLHRAGFLNQDPEKSRKEELGLAVAQGLVRFSRSIKAPTTLSELPEFKEEHIKRALSAAKDPQLEMKLQNMPVPLNAALVDEYLEPILRAAASGDFSLIKLMD